MIRGPATAAHERNFAARAEAVCSAAWAGQNLGCTAAAVSRTLGCVGFTPKASAGYGYIINRTGADLVVTATNLYFSGTCDSKCITCRKDLVPGLRVTASDLEEDLG